MATKTKVSAAAIAEAIIGRQQADEQAAAEARQRDLATYVALVREAAGTPAADRIGQQWSNLLTAARIIGGKVGHDAASDVASLDSIKLEADLTAEFGDLPSKVAALNAEFSTYREQEQALLEKQGRERYEQSQHFEERGRLQVRLSQAVTAAAAARLAISHLEG